MGQLVFAGQLSSEPVRKGMPVALHWVFWPQHSSNLNRSSLKLDPGYRTQNSVPWETPEIMFPKLDIEQSSEPSSKWAASPWGLWDFLGAEVVVNLDAAGVYCEVPLCPSSCRRGCPHPLLWSLVPGFCFLFMESFSFLLTRDVFPSSCQLKTQVPVCLRKRFDCLFYSSWLRMKWVLGTSILSTWAPLSLISKPYVLLYGSQVTGHKKINLMF